MGRIKPRFTFEKHQEVGSKLKQIIVQYREVRLEIVNAFPDNTPASKEAHEVLNKLNELKNKLDNEFYNLKEAKELKSPYYGEEE
jgi:hypothetical protein